MKNKVQFIIFLFFGLAFLIYLFTFDVVHAAKLESGVTVNGTSTPETEKICDDQMDNDNDGKIDSDDEDCAAAPAGPTAGTCGPLQIVSGVPINYGQIKPSQDSAEQKVTIKNVGTSPKYAIIIVKGGNWISDAAGNPTISGPEYTHYSQYAGLYYNMKKLLSSNGDFLANIAGGQSLTAYFQFRPMPNVPSGSFHQEVTLDLIC